MKTHFKHEKTICGTRSKSVTRQIKYVTCRSCLNILRKAIVYAYTKLGIRRDIL